MPGELVVVLMNQSALPPLPTTPFPVRAVTIERAKSALPLAAARNLAARTARFEHLLFLDVDCIAAPDLMGRMWAVQGAAEGLVMGTICYLAARLPADWDYNYLEAHSAPHPQRPHLTQEWKLSERYELFWSLCFAVRRTIFDRAGGFDEGFVGYGAEDTDFAFRARRAGIPFLISQARCYHQYHASSVPPVEHLRDIVANATYFRQVWGQWPMEGWLRAFDEMGLVSWQSDRLTLLRLPTAEELGAARSE